MKTPSRKMWSLLQRSLLEWKFVRGGTKLPDSIADFEAGRYEEVEEVCLRRGMRSSKIVRRLVPEA